MGQGEPGPGVVPSSACGWIRSTPCVTKNMGILYDRRGNHAAALEAYQAYARLRPRSRDAAVLRTRIAWLSQMVRQQGSLKERPPTEERRP